MNILVTGSTGYIGKNLIQKLATTKHNIYELSRNTSKDDTCNIIKNNKITCIINLVGIIKETKDNTFEKSHIEFIKELIEVGNKTHIKLFIQLSALGVYENIQTKYFKSKELAEEIIKASNIPYTIIRPSIIFGKSDSSIAMFSKIMRLTHIFPVFAGGKYLIQPVHIDDLTNLIINIILSSKYINRTIEIAGPKTYMFKEMIKAIKKNNKTKALIISIPMFLSKLIASLGNIAPLPIDTDRLTMLLKGNYIKRRKNNSIIQISGTLGLESAD
ncbi:MAG: NAD-dependent epimerase/dehydratase family protein [bacterium]